jgi:hypothetical protein
METRRRGDTEKGRRGEKILNCEAKQKSRKLALSAY